ncbi:hypothetical protein ACJIZ3_012836 [Penstemon smallii]|uniref:Uncharacterized protein ycf33 n=1 Tax=Penstemon smallii TaxID=265156 RepID=A0ABD3UN66_9LAMI
MNTLRLLQLHFRPTNPAINLPQIIPIIKAKSNPINHHPSSSNSVNSKTTRNSTRINKHLLLEDLKSERFSNGHSRKVVLGAMSLGVALFLMGFDDHSKAMAFGPEGPLVEEFWDNMRRYALYALTVSTGALAILLEPIFELLKNPISAVLVLVILGGGFFIVSQVVTAMVGLSDFSYDYNY